LPLLSILRERYNYKNFLKVSVVFSNPIKVNKTANFEYVPLRPIVSNKATVANLVNGAARVSPQELTLSRTLEDGIKELLEVDPADGKCKRGICGKPDFLKDGFPGEIKSFNRRIKQHVLETAIYQAALYAWLYDTRYAYLILAIYEPINDTEAEIKEIIEIKLHLEYIDEKKLMLEKEEAISKLLEKETSEPKEVNNGEPTSTQIAH